MIDRCSMAAAGDSGLMFPMFKEVDARISAVFYYSTQQQSNIHHPTSWVQVIRDTITRRDRHVPHSEHHQNWTNRLTNLTLSGL